jgi:class 3 adenylate cyclase
MSVFRCDFHLDHAIEACLAVRNKIAELPTDSQINFKPSVSIGINSGEMVLGNIGSSSLRRLNYTVIGDVVNTAQRLQSSAGPGQVIINQNSYQKVKEFFKCEKVGLVNFKNKAEAMMIYEVVE